MDDQPILQLYEQVAVLNLTSCNMTAILHDFVSFLNASPTPYHAVAAVKTRLIRAGFLQLRENTIWSVQAGGKYFVTRNGSSIIAFAVGMKHVPGNAISMIAAHTDSPALRVKPRSRKLTDGYAQVGVECYGGLLAHTWFDRDLSLAGRVMVNVDGSSEQKLLKIEKPILRIPTLAIHLDRSVNEAFKFNKETHLTPVLGQIVEKDLNSMSASGLPGMTQRHHPAMLDLIASELQVAVDDIQDFELLLYDVQPATLGGISDEFIFSARLDNLGCTYAAITGVIASLEDDSLADDNTVRLVSLFDHEEIGSLSQQGADSNFLPSVIQRINGSSEHAAVGLAKSFLISADMAHAFHPNYAGNYENEHKPKLNAGTVLKVNANQRYTTNAPGIVLMEQIAKSAGIQLQLFVVKNDSPCGGTVGPMLAAKLGCRTIDLGNPMLSMHSIRETGGTKDVVDIVKFFKTYFNQYSRASERILVD